MAIQETGCLDYKELTGLRQVPSDVRYTHGPVAVIECVQCIPCNPCESSCSKNAIHIGDPITNLPELDEEKCIGCGICVSRCPGLAIFIVDKTYTKTTAAVSFPYEYIPLPKEGDMVRAVNRKGEYVCDGRIVKIMNPKSFDHTPVVTVEIPFEQADEIRGMERL
ncbi:MAG: 4Fe-4S binding protein [Treponema sp.]|nr:4Fe-4S binding protein [Treponema sp.]